MTDIGGLRYEEPGTIEVRVRRHGVVVLEERCESAEQAAAVVATWSDVEDAEVEVVDLLHGDRLDEFIEAVDEGAFPTFADELDEADRMR